MSALPVTDQEKKVEELVSKVNELAVLPHVVFKVLEVSGSTDSPASELEKTIVVDPGFSAKLLTHANSAFYGLPKKVTSIKDAVCFLGFKAVRQMAMTVGVFDLFVGRNDKESLRRRAWWRHSVDTAVCCRWLAQRTGKLVADEAYTCGLLHLIGKTLLDRFDSSGFERVERLMANGKDQLQAEMEVFGCDHIQIARAAALKWGLPENLVEAMNYIDERRADDPFASYSACVALSTHLASAAVTRNETVLPAWALAALGFEEAETEMLLEQGTEAIANAASMQM